MIKRIKSTRIVTENDSLLDGYLYFDTESGLITHVGDGTPAFDSEEDIGEHYLAPGLIDIHTHGAAGYDYGEVTSVEQALAALNYQASRGATTVLATLTSASLACGQSWRCAHRGPLLRARGGGSTKSRIYDRASPRAVRENR